MRWYQDLYVGYNVLENRNKVIRKIKNGKLQPGKYVLALPENDYDVLDIYPAYVLTQKWYRKSDMVIVGITDGWEETLDMMQLVIMDCLNDTGNVNVKKYILDKMN